MNTIHVPLKFGKTCRFRSAIAAETRLPEALAARAVWPLRRFAEIAQSPPATLFAALTRAARRRSIRCRAASGMPLAMRTTSA
jgi:hypothetical protein